ncbi:MAG: FMN-dependent NADH-azoreductase [Beijerinckiaceae bacterium]|jgi:FMN-dependent NADH-azoreductase
MTILHIDSSILGENSVSRQLSAAITAAEKKRRPDLAVVTRDLAAEPLLHLGPSHIAAWHGAAPEDRAVQADLAEGAGILEELFAAESIVIGAPMYNFGIPSQLKAWIDRLLIAGKTFHYTAQGPEGLVPSTKKVFIASSRGGAYGPETPAAFLDHQETYLKGALGFIGLTDVTVIRAEGVALGPEAREAAIGTALAQVAAL